MSTLRNVMVVEDEALILQLAVMSLEDISENVFSASNVNQAISLLNGIDTLDVLVTDVSMPGNLDGVDLAAAIREKFPNCAIVIMSGRSLPTDRPIPDGSSFVSKPWTTDCLLNKVKEAFSKLNAV